MLYDLPLRTNKIDSFENLPSIHLGIFSLLENKEAMKDEKIISAMRSVDTSGTSVVESLLTENHFVMYTPDKFKLLAPGCFSDNSISIAVKREENIEYIYLDRGDSKRNIFEERNKKDENIWYVRKSFIYDTTNAQFTKKYDYEQKFTEKELKEMFPVFEFSVKKMHPMKEKF